MTKKTDSTKPDAKKTWQQWKFDVPLPSGQTVKVTVRQGEETVDLKCKAVAGFQQFSDYTVPIYKNLRDRKGEYVTTPFTVRGVRLTVRFENGERIEVRSCCKPPDVFKGRLGRRRALRRLFLIDSGFDPAKPKVDGEGKPVRNDDREPRLNGEDRKELFRAVLRNGKPAKPRAKPVAAETAVRKETVSERKDETIAG